MNFGLAHIMSEGCAMHPDSFDNHFTDDEYRVQLSKYIDEVAGDNIIEMYCSRPEILRRIIDKD